MSAESGLIVSVSGIRGIVGQSLTPAAALAFASALGAHTGSGRIIVSRDGRPSGLMLRHAVLAGLTAAEVLAQRRGERQGDVRGEALADDAAHARNADDQIVVRSHVCRPSAGDVLQQS